MRRDKVIRLANHDRADDALNQLAASGPSRAGDGRFLFFPGSAGSGKSTYVRHAAQERGAPMISLRMTSTLRSTMSDLAHETNRYYVMERRVDDLVRRCAVELREHGTPFVLIDEGDVLNQSPRFALFNTLRWLADNTGTAIVVFSTAALMRRFAIPTPYLEQISSRVVAQVEFARPALADAVKLAEVVEGVELERDLIRICLESARGSIRPLLNLYEQIETTARCASVEGRLDLARASKLGLIIRPERVRVENAQAAPISVVANEVKVA